METKKAIKTMLQASGNNSQTAASFLNLSQPAFSIWLQKLNQIERLIKLTNFCGCKIIITNDKDINITLSEK